MPRVPPSFGASNPPTISPEQPWSYLPAGEMHRGRGREECVQPSSYLHAGDMHGGIGREGCDVRPRGREMCPRREMGHENKKRKRKSVSHVKVSVVTIADGKNYSSKNKKNPYLKNVGTKKIQTF